MESKYTHNLIHGECRTDRKTRLYNIWSGIKQRVLNKNYHCYDTYGGRGIGICNEWLDFIEFAKWARGNGYEDKLEIDRIDNNGSYEPSNCRFVTRSVNSINKSKRREWGIHKHGRKWRIVISRNSILYHVGGYYSLEESIQKRDEFLERLIELGITKF